MVEQINKERYQSEVELRKSMYMQFVQFGYICESGDHNDCFHRLCIEGDCEWEPEVNEEEDGSPDMDTPAIKTEDGDADEL